MVKSAGLFLTTLIAVASCGNGARRVEQPVEPTVAPVDAAPVETTPATDGAIAEAPSRRFEPELPAGVNPFSPAEFVTFLGIRHGGTKADVLALLPANAGKLGARGDLDIMGSEGFTYSGHFAISWVPETGQIDYVSVKSDDTVAYLASHGRRDTKLDTLWGVSPPAALGILGQPTEVVELPHAWTFRFDFEARGRAGTLSLEFSKLAETLGCSAVSVHYRY